jgi:nitrilase
MRVAAAQARPVWLNPTETTKNILTWIEEAAAQQVEMLVFPETFLPGYPVWIERTNGSHFGDALQQKAFAAYLNAAVTADGPELAQIAQAACDLGVFVYLGIAERGTSTATGTTFSTLVAIDPASGIAGTHRKLIPTFEERLVWGFGDGNGLRTHRVGEARVGGLNCWENWMPQARHAMYAGGEDIHVSIWPGNPNNTQDLVRFIAMEGRVWSLGACGLLGLGDIPRDFPLYEALQETGETVFRRGGSAIAAPDGSWLVEPVVDEERLVIGDVDLGVVREARYTLDPTGHYSRPDVFHVRVDRSRRAAAHFAD